MDHEFLNSKVVGKTVQFICEDEWGVEITFTDGTVLQMKARGTEEQWIETEVR